MSETTTPRERPILMSGPLVREILANRKTMTRRPVKPQPPSLEEVRRRTGSGFHLFTDDSEPADVFRVAGPCGVVRELVGQDHWRCPYGAPGDRLWVRETFIHEPPSYCYEASTSIPYDPGCTVYRADMAPDRAAVAGPWKPGIHMPRSICRLVLEVTAVRVERLHEITEEDARAEGVADRAAFEAKWREIYGAESWEADPFVWCISFRRTP